MSGLITQERPPPGPARPRRPDRVEAPTPRSSRGLAVVAVLVASLIGWLGASAGHKGMVVLVAGLGMVAATAVSHDRVSLLLGIAVASLGLLVKKSLGPIDTSVASGAPSLFLTAVDVVVVLLYVTWWLEGTLVHDVLSAARMPVFWLPAAAAFLFSLSIVVAAKPGLAFDELARMGWLYLLFVAVALRVRTRRQVWAILMPLGGLAVFELLVVVVQWRSSSALGLSIIGTPDQLGQRVLDTGEIARPFGTLIHPVFLGAVMGVIALMALSIGLHLAPGRRRRLCLAVVPVCIAPMLISHTRGAFAAFIPAVVGVTIVALARRRISRRAIVVSAACALVLLVAAWPQLSRLYHENFATQHFSVEVESRKQLNDVAYAIIRTHPLTGVGLNNFQHVMDPYAPFGLLFPAFPVHNLYLLQAAETGYGGLVMLVLVGLGVLAVAVRAGRVHDPLLAGVGVGVAAMCVFLAIEELISYTLREDVSRSLFWMLAGLSVACLRMARREGLDVR